LKKHSRQNNVCSQCSVTWQTDAIGLQKCDLGLPSLSSFTEAVTTITVQELSNTTSYTLYGVWHWHDEAVPLLPVGLDVFCKLHPEASTGLHSRCRIHISTMLLKMG
jgi:hypothetical protein